MSNKSSDSETIDTVQALAQHKRCCDWIRRFEFHAVAANLCMPRIESMGVRVLLCCHARDVNLDGSVICIIIIRPAFSEKTCWLSELQWSPVGYERHICAFLQLKMRSYYKILYLNRSYVVWHNRLQNW